MTLLQMSSLIKSVPVDGNESSDISGGLWVSCFVRATYNATQGLHFSDCPRSGLDPAVPILSDLFETWQLAASLIYSLFFPSFLTDWHWAPRLVGRPHHAVLQRGGGLAQRQIMTLKDPKKKRKNTWIQKHSVECVVIDLMNLVRTAEQRPKCFNYRLAMIIQCPSQ